MRINAYARFAALLAAAVVLPAFAQQNTGYLKTKVNPGRAGVFLDGKYIGPAGNFRIGRKYVVAAGEHEVRLSEPRYEDLITKVSIQPGQTTKLAETMKPLAPAKPPFGRLRTVAPDKFAPVFVNGKFMGHVGEFNNPVQGLMLNPGDYAVRIGDGQEEHIKIDADKVTVIRAAK